MFSLGSQKFKHLTWKFSREPRVKKRALLGLCICHWKYNWKDNSEICLPFKTCTNFTTQRFKEGHNWIIVITLSKLVSKVYANISSPDVYWRKRLKHWTHLELCQGSHDTLERVLPNHVIQLNCMEMLIHRSGKTTRTWESFKTEKQNCPSFQMNYD